MSRTAFAERFREVVGEVPLQYPTSWRMQNAKRFLAESRMTLATVARRVGYESTASFSRAFKGTVGETPGSYRQLEQQNEWCGGMPPRSRRWPHRMLTR